MLTPNQMQAYQQFITLIVFCYQYNTFYETGPRAQYYNELWLISTDLNLKSIATVHL